MTSAPGAVPNSMLAWALRYVRLGWRVLPLKGKGPAGDLAPHGSKDGTLDERQVHAWWNARPTANIGICTGWTFFALDVDLRKGGEDSLEELVAKHGPLPDTIQQVTGTGGKHYLFRMPAFPVHNSEGKLGPGLDIRGLGGYVVAAPSIHPETRRAYDWDGIEEIEQQQLAEAPAWLLEWLRTQGQPGGKVAGPSPVPAKIPKGKQHSTLVSIAGSMRRRGLEADEIYAALKVINETRCTEPGPDRNIRRIAESVAKYPPDAKADVFRRLAADAEEEAAAAESCDVRQEIEAAIEAKDLEAVLRLAPAAAGLPFVEIAVLKAKLRSAFGKDFSVRDFERLVGDQHAGDVPPPSPEAPGGVGDGPDLLTYPHTDSGNAERLVALYGQDIRYCIEMRRWLVWDGRRWAVDEQQRVKQLAKRMARILYVQAAEMPEGSARTAIEKWARKSESAAGISATLASAEHEPGIPVSAADLDTHPYLLNCLNGVLDLREQKLLPHDRSYLITKLCHVEYDPNAKCPQFERFLERVMGGNEDAELDKRTRRLMAFLQRAFGYTLTADVSAKAVFCFFGRGNNGKTTLLETFRYILSEYSAQVNIDTLLVKPGGESNATLADLADLRGARFVTTSEPEEGQRLKVGKLKYLSAGMGEIKSMRKYENPIYFQATHKLFLDGNHRPVVPAGGDEALWNRLKPVPFTVIIPASEIDPLMKDKLRGEAQGILAWAVRGCARWMQVGLGDPPEVGEETASWRSNSDPLKDFLDDACELDPEGWVPITQMAKAYERWAVDNGERYKLSRQKFNDQMEQRGLKRTKRYADGVSGARGWSGVFLRAPYATF